MMLPRAKPRMCSLEGYAKRIWFIRNFSSLSFLIPKSTCTTQDILQRPESHDTISLSAKDGGGILHLVGRIALDMYTEISASITTNEVIITAERIEHSNLHDHAFDKYGKYIPEVLADPDFIFRDKKPHTAVLVKRVIQEGKHLQLVLRLHVPQDDPQYKNSIISFWDISDKRRENYERNKDIIYKKP